jgi:hypothetical protein
MWEKVTTLEEINQLGFRARLISTEVKFVSIQPQCKALQEIVKVELRVKIISTAVDLASMRQR